MDVNANGKMFVTVGVRHVKFWFLERNNNAETITLQVHYNTAFNIFIIYF